VSRRWGSHFFAQCIPSMVVGTMVGGGHRREGGGVDDINLEWPEKPGLKEGCG
jgi:hypothetical protein